MSYRTVNTTYRQLSTIEDRGDDEYHVTDEITMIFWTVNNKLQSDKRANDDFFTSQK